MHIMNKITVLMLELAFVCCWTGPGCKASVRLKSMTRICIDLCLGFSAAWAAFICEVTSLRSCTVFNQLCLSSQLLWDQPSLLQQERKKENSGGAKANQLRSQATQLLPSFTQTPGPQKINSLACRSPHWAHSYKPSSFSPGDYH